MNKSSNCHQPIPVIAALEDEPDFRRLLQLVLSPEFDLVFVEDSQALASLIEQRPLDLILMDIVLPGEDGIEIAKSLKARVSIPVILLSGLSSDDMVARGLNIGADDYVTKPCNAEVLRARIRNALRRGRQGSSASVQQAGLKIGDCSVDPLSREIRHPNGGRERLTEKEFQLLAALARTPAIPVDRDVLSRLLTGHEWSPNTRSLDVHISNLRQKLKHLTKTDKVIVHFRNVGYALKLDALSEGS